MKNDYNIRISGEKHALEMFSNQNMPSREKPKRRKKKD